MTYYHHFTGPWRWSFKRRFFRGQVWNVWTFIEIKGANIHISYISNRKISTDSTWLATWNILWLKCFRVNCWISWENVGWFQNKGRFPSEATLISNKCTLGWLFTPRRKKWMKSNNKASVKGQEVLKRKWKMPYHLQQNHEGFGRWCSESCLVFWLIEVLYKALRVQLWKHSTCHLLPTGAQVQVI